MQAESPFPARAAGTYTAPVPHTGAALAILGCRLAPERPPCKDSGTVWGTGKGSWSSWA